MFHRITKEPKQLAVIALLVLFVSLSWFRPIDTYTTDYLSESIKTAAIIFGVSRAINAAVSVAQSAQVGVVVTVAPGEALDPINDLIERFSEIMTISLTSLVFQKILLEVTAHGVFSALVTLAAIFVVASLFLRRYRIATLKVFAILVVVRLFLATTVLANSIVDYAFLDISVSEAEKQIDSLKSEVTAASAMAAGQGAATEERKAQIRTELNHKAEERERLERLISTASSEIERLESEKPEISIWERLSENPELKRWNELIDQQEQDINQFESEKRDLAKAKSVLEEELDCLEKRSAGEKCSWLETFRVSGDWLTFPALNIEDKIDALITLMALMILRSILLPLFFWLVLYKIIRWVWTKQFSPRPT